MPLQAGSVIKGNLRLEHELGRGGMGVVWVAENSSLGSKVAVKVLHAASTGSEEARARFAQEARGVARIDSPHVVRIYDYGVSDEGEPFIVMELLRGTDLRSHLGQVRTMSPEDTEKLVRQTCAALGRAHELGIVHRDVKPANVFLVEGTGDVFAKVLDFGVAKYLGNQDMNMTSTQALMGTPYYMSPEQFIDARAIDARSDLWSVAVVAYACLAGKLPFLGESVGALSLAVHGGQFTPITAARPGLPAGLDAWFRRALSPAREQRFQSAKELADAFGAALRGGLAAAPPASLAAAAPPMAASPSTVAGPSTAGAGVLASVAASTPSAGGGTSWGSPAAPSPTWQSQQAAPQPAAQPAPATHWQSPQAAAHAAPSPAPATHGQSPQAATQSAPQPAPSATWQSQQAAPQATPQPAPATNWQSPQGAAHPAAPPALATNWQSPQGAAHPAAPPALATNWQSPQGVTHPTAPPAPATNWQSQPAAGFSHVAGAAPVHGPPPSRRGALFLGVGALLLVGLGALAFAVLPGLGGEEAQDGGEPARSTAPSAATAPATGSGATAAGPAATVPPRAATTARAPASPAAAAPPAATSAAATAVSTAGTAASATGTATASGLRPRNMRCKAGTTKCIACCPAGDVLGPFPQCECYIPP